jgi:hypothetical protein
VNKKDVVYRNIGTLTERIKNLSLLFRNSKGDFESRSEMLVLIYAMKTNLTTIEETIQEIKEWKDL